MSGAPHDRGDELWIIAPALGSLASATEEHRLTGEQRRHVSFVLELVDLLATRHGFDPDELVNPRTGEPLGPLIKKLLHEPAHRIRRARQTWEGRAQVDALSELFAARDLASVRTASARAAALRIPRTRARTPATSPRAA